MKSVLMKTLAFSQVAFFFQEKGHAKLVHGLSIVHLTGNKNGTDTQQTSLASKFMPKSQILKILI